MKSFHDLFNNLSSGDFAMAKENRALDSAIQAFVNEIEQRNVPFTEIMQGGAFVKLATSAQDEPGWENFFIYRNHVLAYRYITGTHTSDKTQAVVMEFTLQALPLLREQWPRALENFIKLQ